MGTIISKDTRRVSFDNTIKIAPALTLSKLIEDDDILEIGSIENMKPPTESNKETLKGLGMLEDEHDYWAKRIECLKNEHKIINKIIESEYEKTIERTKDLFKTPVTTQEKIQKVKPCFDWRHKILQCYEDNLHQPLVCSHLVQEFSTCVSACNIEE